MTNEYDSSRYGDQIADVFDAWYGEESPKECIELLHELAGPGGRIAELGVGTGRVAIPLAKLGHPVEGVESSQEMVSELRRKVGGASVTLIVGDMADAPVSEGQSVVACVDNTLFLLDSQQMQVQLFEKSAAALAPGGRVVIEVPARVPRTDEDEHGLFVESVQPERVGLWVVDHDRANQKMAMQQVSITNGDVRIMPVPVRYAWPAELDLMAQMAGLKLESRWSGWDRAPFTSRSVVNISVYVKG